MCQAAEPSVEDALHVAILPQRFRPFPQQYVEAHDRRRRAVSHPAAPPEELRDCGFVDPEGITSADRIAGIICSALAALGYSVGRSNVKAAASMEDK